jgi:tetratricopeptide (TPR) repeat protein
MATTVMGLYFCSMKQVWLIIGVLLVFACKNKEQKADSLKNEQFSQEVEQLLNNVAKHPDSIGLRVQLVDALDSMGKFQLAMVQMDSLIKKDSGNFGLWFKLGSLKERSGDTLAAIGAYGIAAKIYPTPDVLLTLGNLFAETKDSRVFNTVKQVAQMRLGRTYQSHCDFIVGVYYARTGNASSAISQFNACINNNYGYLEAYMEKGFLFYDSKKYSEANQVFQTVVTIKNNYADGYYWLGKTAEAQQQKQEAITQYERSLALDPNLKEASSAISRLKN